MKSQIRCILLSLPLEQNSYSEASESWLFMSSDKFKTNFLDRNIFSYSISIFFPEIKITEINKFIVCLKSPLFCSWSCNFYRIWICSGCVRAPVESLYSVPIHVSAHGSWGQMVLLWFKYVFTSRPCWLSHQPEDLWISTNSPKQYNHLQTVLSPNTSNLTPLFFLCRFELASFCISVI